MPAPIIAIIVPGTTAVHAELDVHQQHERHADGDEREPRGDEQPAGSPSRGGSRVAPDTTNVAIVAGR